MNEYIELKIKLKSYRKPIIIEFNDINLINKFTDELKHNSIIVFGQLTFNRDDFQSAIICYKENKHVRYKHNKCSK